MLCVLRYHSSSKTYATKRFPHHRYILRKTSGGKRHRVKMESKTTPMLERGRYKNDPRQFGPRHSSLYLGCLWSCHRRDEAEQRGSNGELFTSSFKLVRSQKKVVKGHIEVLQNSNSNQKETRYKQKTCNAHSW